jgi:hypothetical protein
VTQYLLSLTLSDEDVAAPNAALSHLESRLSGQLALDNATRREINKMEKRCRGQFPVAAEGFSYAAPCRNLI